MDSHIYARTRFVARPSYERVPSARVRLFRPFNVVRVIDLNGPLAWHAVLGNHDYGDCGYDEVKGEVGLCTFTPCEIRVESAWFQRAWYQLLAGYHLLKPSMIICFQPLLSVSSCAATARWHALWPRTPIAHRCSSWTLRCVAATGAGTANAPSTTARWPAGARTRPLLSSI